MMTGSSRIRRALLALGLLALLAGGGFAFAQQGEFDAPVDQGEEGEVAVRQREALSPQEQVEEANKIQDRAVQSSRRLQAMLDEARRDGDIIRVTCINDKLTQVNANLRTLQQRVDSLTAAVDGGDANRGGHEYTVITVLAQKFQVLDQEANQCVGQDVFETGATKVETAVDPATPDEDPGVLHEPPEVEAPFIPPPASGVL